MKIPFLESPQDETPASAGCHAPARTDADGLPLVAIVGNPNVGKSVLFNRLTGTYVTVSNFPGTTVELSQGKGQFDGAEVAVVDTPGMYGLLPITEEERVARRILLEKTPDVVIHVVDAKNLERMLPMTLQLIDAGLPVVLDVNLMDEAERLGVKVDVAALERELGIPVVATALTRGDGLRELRETIQSRLEDATPPLAPADRPAVRYPEPVEQAVREIEMQLGACYPISHRALALLLLQDDEELMKRIHEREDGRAPEIASLVETARGRFSRPVSYVAAQALRRRSKELLEPVVTLPPEDSPGFAERLSEAMINPITGVPILLLSLFLLYEFVGVLGAQTLVDLLEESLFGAYVNPWVNRVLATLIPWPWLRSLFGGEYGIITLGVRYAVALILPIVGTFFVAFSIIEDSGYLPRLALLIDRVFKKIGLNGRAVIPMVLGFGCDTMATIVTRTLETRRERVLSTLLLALAVPCSAQLGVMLGLLAGHPAALFVWIAVVTGVFLLVGYLAAQVMPGEGPTFYMELPPLRMPTLGNVLVKTYTRMEWYFREVFPMFILASVVIWLGQLTGLFDVVVNGLEPIITWIGLPQETAVAFLFGFFRRDYGAAGLYDLRQAMDGVQLVVAATTMTIFVPCIAQFSVTIKERGWKTALAIVAFIFPFAFLVGGAVNWVLTTLGVAL
jgi:ferrous iron transport protein B